MLEAEGHVVVRYIDNPNGSLRDSSPTMLGMLGVDEPKEMTGTDLRAFVKNNQKR